MTEKSWTIGSAESCDIVVTDSMVSSEHCRLTFTGEELQLEDLNSTNGTHVNGMRIQEAVTVTPSDRITLGTSVPLPWPAEIEASIPKPAASATPTASAPTSPPTSAEPGSKVITIGRADDNSIVLQESNVSSYHARLTIEGSQITIEDLGSTNGTSVGTVENKIQRAVLKGNETIYFGSSAFALRDLLAGGSPTPKAPEKPSPASPSVGNVPPALLIGGGVGAAVLLILFIGWMFSGGDTNDDNKVAAKSPDDKAGQTQPKTDPEPKTKKLDNTQPVTPAAAPVEESLFLIVCADEAQKTPFKVATGFAVGKRTIATTASSIEMIQKMHRDGYPKRYIKSLTQGEIGIASMKIHPQYEQARKDADAAMKEYDVVYERATRLAKPDPAELEKIRNQLVNARIRAVEALERKTVFDVGVLEIETDVKHWLEGVAKDANLRPKLKVAVVGFPFDVQDPFFDNQVRLETKSTPSRIHQVTAPPQTNSTRRVSAEAAPSLQEFNHTGCPVLNVQGQVVGIFSRLTPPPPTEDDTGETPPVAKFFDAPLFARITELTSNL